MAAVATRASTTAMRMARTLLCIPVPRYLAAARASDGGDLLDPHGRPCRARPPRRRVGHERDDEMGREVEGDGEVPSDDVVGDQAAVGQVAQPGLGLDDIPERDAAAEVGAVVA